ncbi:Hypothetical Protein FCC1311_111862 [Hondaea fermentalgiana]|uniref:Uncharacterized protein n=1 Tax=Hondaea fermentalgiana TaxID=2315210 RepID=A0A2R5H1K5_9STRA|nr:Hypothetical Protein FCC1311_111862 [Hondaea fermentalgiana]|eukprot:GBG34963.1 Hypothetical Protein FCC1311_111862 [Hondaea fermentalgiana]
MPVLLADGSLRSIEQVVAGDQVQSFDEHTNQTTVATVEELLVSEAKELMRLDLDTGRSIWSTPDHPYWSYTHRGVVSFAPTATKAKYMLEARQLSERDDLLQDPAGNPVSVTVASVHTYETSVPVYTLALAPTHWFYVHGVLVHNKGSSSWSSGSTWSSSSSTSSTSTTSYYSSSGGSYTKSSTGYFVGSSGTSWTYISSYRASSYRKSPACALDSTQAGCANSTAENIVCGCPEGSVLGNAASLEDTSPYVSGNGPYSSEHESQGAVTTAFGVDFCSEDRDAGICVDSNYDLYCVPEYLEFTERYTDDPAWRHLEYIIQAHCNEQHSACYDDMSCYYDYLENYTLLAGAYSEPIDGALEVYTNFQQCMNESMIYCRCEWEVCEAEAAINGTFVALVGFFFGCAVLIACCCCRIVQARMSPKVRVVPQNAAPSPAQVSTKTALCFANVTHEYEKTTAADLAARGNKVYLQGWICDKCNQEFPPDSELSHCNTCDLDFCARCVDYR